MITNRRIPPGLVAALICGATGMSGLANGFRLADQDAFATARGEAFVATADNASAIYYNPAGLSQLEGGNVRFGGYGIYYDESYQPPDGAPNAGSTYHIQDHLAGAPQFFCAYTPTGSAVSFGLGVYAPYGGSLNWPVDTGFRTVATQGSLTYMRINPVVALKLAPGWSIAGGIMVDYAKLDMEQGLRPSASPLINYFLFKGDGWSAGYNLGLLWEVHEKVSLGVTFRSSTSFTLDGQTEFEQQPVVPGTERSAHTGFEFPLTAVFGVAYRPTPKWNLEFDADYTEWSSFNQTTIYQAPPLPRPVKQNIPVNLGWQPSWLYEFGVTRYLDKGWHVSAGYVFNQNSVPNTYYAPLAADLDRHFFSVGGGYRGKRLGFDVAYQLGYGPDHTVTGSTPSSTPGLFSGQRANGTYSFISYAVLVTVGLHF